MRTSDSSCPRRFRRITLLLHQFGFDNNRGQIHGWPWYQAAVLLGAIGLGAPFAEAKQSVAAALGLGLAPTLVFCFEVVYLHPAELSLPPQNVSLSKLL
jgi:hypothetical protein